MSLHNNLREELKTAMKAKDTTKLDVVRNILSEGTNYLVSTKRTPQDTLTDQEVIQVIKKLAKQRQDSVNQYKKAQRLELANKEESELTILQTYLPKQMSEEEITNIAKKILASKNNNQQTIQVGVLIGEVMKETKGHADGSKVKLLVESLLKEQN